jgi:hypothetical protein
MTTIEKNRLAGVAFLVLGFFQLITLSLSLLGYSFTYPYIVNTPESAAFKMSEKAAQDDPTVFTPVVPGIQGMQGARNSANPTPMPAPESKAQIEAKRTMTMIYILLGVQFAILLFILFAGFTVVNVRAGGRALGIVASLFLMFFFPLGTIVSICAIWFLTGDECLEIYSEVEKDKRSPQSII